jgi:hypothetical protein
MCNLPLLHQVSTWLGNAGSIFFSLKKVSYYDKVAINKKVEGYSQFFVY